jgi:hypothetical protein
MMTLNTITVRMMDTRSTTLTAAKSVHRSPTWNYRMTLFKLCTRMSSMKN